MGVRYTVSYCLFPKRFLKSWVEEANTQMVFFAARFLWSAHGTELGAGVISSNWQCKEIIAGGADRGAPAAAGHR